MSIRKSAQRGWPGSANANRFCRSSDYLCCLCQLVHPRARYPADSRYAGAVRAGVAVMGDQRHLSFPGTPKIVCIHEGCDVAVGSAAFLLNGAIEEVLSDET